MLISRAQHSNMINQQHDATQQPTAGGVSGEMCGRRERGKKEEGREGGTQREEGAERRYSRISYQKRRREEEGVS
jgi:hypothetical protein